MTRVVSILDLLLYSWASTRVMIVMPNASKDLKVRIVRLFEVLEVL